jgi:peptidoglycan/LPS O-acetylase OafA/YrhL
VYKQGKNTGGREANVRSAVALLCIVGAPLGIALLDTGIPSQSWWLVAAAPIGLYGIYALGVRRLLPARVTGSAPLRTSVAPRGSRRDTDWLLLIRGMACALVFIMHSGMVLKHDFTYGYSRWAWILLSPDELGMVLFFTLSGYLMGKGFYTGKYDLSRSGVTLYLRNRFLRIVPLMVVVGLLAIVWHSPELLSTPQIGVRLLLFGFNGFHGTHAIGPFWSLSTEWQFYLLVPAAFAIALAASRLFTPTPKVLLPVATLLVLVVGIVIRQYQWTHHGAEGSWGVYIYSTLLGNIDVFLLGFLTNWWVPRLARLSRLMGAVWPLLLVWIYLTYSFICYGSLHVGSSAASWISYGSPGNLIFALILPGATALALIPVLVGCEVWNRRARLRKVPQRKTAFALFWVGELTYPIYLVHYSIFASVQKGLPHASYAVRWATGAILVILIAWAFHMTVEEAVLRWRRRHATEDENRMAPETRQEVDPYDDHVMVNAGKP